MACMLRQHRGSRAQGKRKNNEPQGDVSGRKGSEIGRETFDFPITIPHGLKPATSVNFLERGGFGGRLVIGVATGLRFGQRAGGFRRQFFGGRHFSVRGPGLGRGRVTHAINLGRRSAIG